VTWPPRSSRSSLCCMEEGIDPTLFSWCRDRDQQGCPLEAVTETGEGAGRVGTVLRRHDATAALARGCSIAAAPAAAQTGEVGHLFVVGKMWEMGGMELCDGRKQKRNHDSQQRVDEIHN
jgi:hypothetical protein